VTRRALTVIVLAVTTACGGSEAGTAGPSPSSAAPTPTATATATPSLASLPAAVTTRVHVGHKLGGPGFPGGWVVAFGSVWVPEGDAGRLTRFALPTGEQTVIEIGDPSKDVAGIDPQAAAVAGERIAVTDRAAKAVALVDPATNAVAATVEVGVAAYAIAVDGDTVWATDYEGGTVVRASARTGKVIGTSQVPGPEGAVAANGAAWVASETGAVYRVDATNGAAAVVPGTTGGNIETMALGGGAVWALDKQAGKVFRVDPRSGRTVAAVKVVLGEQADAGICFGAGTAWVIGSPAGRNVLGISAATNRVAVQATLPVGTQSCAFGGSLVWTFSGESASDGDEVLGLDPRKLG
jgi:sugar lactone lactonase YvrE